MAVGALTVGPATRELGPLKLGWRRDVAAEKGPLSALHRRNGRRNRGSVLELLECVPGNRLLQPGGGTSATAARAGASEPGRPVTILRDLILANVCCRVHRSEPACSSATSGEQAEATASGRAPERRTRCRTRDENENDAQDNEILHHHEEERRLEKHDADQPAQAEDGEQGDAEGRSSKSSHGVKEGSGGEGTAPVATALEAAGPEPRKETGLARQQLRPAPHQGRGTGWC